MNAALLRCFAGVVILFIFGPGQVGFADDLTLTRHGNLVVVPPRTSPDTFGTADTTVQTLWASDFQYIAQVVPEPPQDPVTGLRNGAPFVAAAHLPAGALLTSIELEACDSSPTDAVLFVLLRFPAPLSR